MTRTYGLELNSSVDKEKIKEVEIKLDVSFPIDYVRFITTSNGAEGSIGENYLLLWSIEDIINLNEAYAVNDFAKGLVLFGSDGADMAYAYDTRTSETPIVSVPFIGMDIKEIIIRSDSFYGFLEYLFKNHIE